MTDKTITIEITGNEAIIEPALAAFCYQGGYSDDVVIFNNGVPETLPNPISKTEFAKQRLSQFFRGEVAVYNANQASVTAIEAAQAQTLGAMDLVTMNVEIN